jgi:MFS family permease
MPIKTPKENGVAFKSVSNFVDLSVRGRMVPRTQQWLVLAVVLMGTFMAILDVAIVNVAIPSIRSDMHASLGEVELVISAYTLTYACPLVTGGRLGDLYGRKRLFILGLLVFGAASALCGFAPTAWALIGARAIQGVGGALMYPQVLATIQVTFVGEERGKALGIFGSVIGLAAIAGQILGGLLLAADIWELTWRPIFLVNVPLALGTAIAATFVLGKDQRQDNVGLDWGGVGIITPVLCLVASNCSAAGAPNRLSAQRAMMTSTPRLSKARASSSRMPSSVMKAWMTSCVPSRVKDERLILVASATR